MKLTSEEFKDLAYFKALSPDKEKFYKYFTKEDVLKLKANLNVAKFYFEKNEYNWLNKVDNRFFSNLYNANPEWRNSEDIKLNRKVAGTAYEYAQLKDSEFKKQMSIKYGESDKLKLNSDYEKIIDDTIYTFEYENSSRGLTSNLAKILRKSNGRKIKVFFIRTLVHEYCHTPDARNFIYLCKNLKIENVEIFMNFGWNFHPCLNLQDNFKEYLKVN
ncbi:MAG: hypothetical protein PHF86_10250 [Candidatus Nanoarchaeia archaeon]|jgi:hypothetical protein|nr:hypothetical protein [Candidatus Nanoarchaeia archaeon]